MLRAKIKNWIDVELDKLAPMSPKKKIEYIWYYYKWWLLGFMLLIVITVTGVQDLQYQNKQLLLKGIFINTSTSAEGYAYAKDTYWEHTGADPDTRVELIEARSIRFNVEQPTQTDVNLIMSVDTMIAAAELDYIIGDASSVQFYDNRDSLLDLSKILTQEQLSGLNVITSKNGIVAIDLTGSVLQEKFGFNTEPSYLMILVNTARQEQCADFIQYLLSE